VKPSIPYEMKDKYQESSHHSIFQMPLLPCFASEFHDRPVEGVKQSKKIKEGDGVWKIGKIKIIGNKSVMRIG
jgi:hypothetical protein